MIYSFWLIQACDVYENSLANDIYDKEEYKEAMSLLRYDGFEDMFYNILQIFKSGAFFAVVICKNWYLLSQMFVSFVVIICIVNLLISWPFWKNDLLKNKTTAQN